MIVKSITVGISLPEDLLAKIDQKRGDVSRSRFLQKLVKEAIIWKEKEHEGGNVIA